MKQLLLTLLVVALAVAVVAMILVVVVHLWRERRRRVLIPVPPRPALPVVLCHGLLGFDEMRLADARYEYFRVASWLRELGADVHRPRVPPVASVRRRAERLAAFIRGLEGPVNIVAHSMGGLDARYAISRLDLAPHVASLVTIGTPHRGTPLADLGAAVLDKLGIRRMLRFFDVDIEAFFDLSQERARRFNQDVPDAPGVAYLSIVGVTPAGGGVHPLLVPCQLYLEGKGGRSDGLVPESSQVWGEVLATVEADHFAQVGWSATYDARGLYVDLMRQLAGRGF